MAQHARTARCGITKNTPDPDGGRIERDAAGNPTGVLVDKAMAIAQAVIPRPRGAEIMAALQAAMTHMNSVGLTGVGDAGVGANIIACYKRLADRGLLSVRIYAMIADTGEDFRALSKAGPLLGYGNDRLTVRSVKLFADEPWGAGAPRFWLPTRTCRISAVCCS